MLTRLVPSPGTPGVGDGEGLVANESPLLIESHYPLTLTLSPEYGGEGIGAVSRSFPRVSRRLMTTLADKHGQQALGRLLRRTHDAR